MKRVAMLLAGFGVAVGTAAAQPPGGFGGPGGGFGGPPGGAERKLVAKFDKDGDGRLNADERKAAREEAKSGGRPGGGRPGGGGFGPPGGRGRGEPGKPGPKVSPGDVANFPDRPLYDPDTLRTLFFTFENADWEKELEDFHNTDVDVPATLTVDGKTYRDVGVHFRGMSSYGMVPAGSKRSLNVALDHADPKQRLYGYKTLNLLNAHEDPSLMSTVLYSHVARKHLPAPKANFVKVVINGEFWGVYPSVQQFNKEFVAENFPESKGAGARWKVSGSPAGGGGLDYLGDDAEQYRRRYEIKSKDDPESWKALIGLCRTLSETPPEKLEAALTPVLDIDGLLWFLALDVALVNNDGYWVRASDYSLYRDPAGKFHVLPHDMNEAFHGGGGPGGPGGGGPGGPGGRMGGFQPPRPGEVLPPPLQDLLRLTDAQKKELAALQKDVDARLDKLLADDQRKQLRDARERGPGGFGPPGMMGGPPGMGSGGIELDPLVGLTDARKPLRSKVLAVPAWRAKYLANVRAIAEADLDWATLGPVVAKYRGLIAKDVAADTRKLDSTEAFERATAPDATTGRGRETPLRAFAEQRRKYLLAHTEVKNASR